MQPRPQQPVAEGELVGRGRQRGAVGAAAKSQGEGKVHRLRVCTCAVVVVDVKW